ncbi:MAG: PAS domain-containing protein [Oscillospiraceae bacterium]|nr:PAS domain-containing protein [Oscillospiraceae bacterium]
MTSRSAEIGAPRSKYSIRRLLPSSSAGSNGAKHQALMLTIIYFFVGSIWIVLSDAILSAALPETIIALGMISIFGVAFVAISAAAIFALVYPTLKKLVELKITLQATNSQLGQALSDLQAETQKVEETEKTLIATQQHAHIGSFVFDIASGTLTCSDEALSICGVKRENFSGTLGDLERYINPDDLEQGSQLYYRSVSENRVMEYYCNIANPNIEGQVVCARFGPVFDENNNCLRILGTVYDITERWQAEIAVIKERNRAQMYLDISGNTFIAIDQDMVVTLINNAGSKLLCYPKEEILGKVWPDHFVFGPCKAKFFEAHEKLRNGNDANYIDYNNSVITGCGEERIISWRLVSIHDEQGNYNGILASGVDITDQERALKALHESERSKSFLLSHIPGMVYRCCKDRNWTMKFLSDGCYKLTGYWPESFINNMDLSYNDIICPEYRDEIWEDIDRAIESKESYRFKYEIITATGDRKWVTEVGQGVFDEDGEFEALEGVVIDISETRQ